MILGYLCQALLFGQAPSLLTIIGAVMMLLAVAIMAATRVPKPSAAPDLSLDSAPEPSAIEGSLASAQVSEDDDSESLVSFVATEFASVGPHSGNIRFRGPGVSDKVPGDFIGVVTTATAVATVAI
eukprot:CAMPEP_0169169692 /NCGR_PEP_ID=MMETSP1015-20121227/61707_1 /TAXON_ID=342587 /ORGANISM="Karlodinium micrum, Strain CCMP2283" /LENGTH=125 /DNA_ID=CAMNT_0009242619 /DNA_START=305 /DNA_END=682 /DNA_ORIENTATION=-